MAQAAQLPIISHYTAYKPRPFTREERDKVTILYGGLTWKHERLMQGALHNLKYNADKQTIHENYTGWIQRLDGAIRSRLTAAGM